MRNFTRLLFTGLLLLLFSTFGIAQKFQSQPQGKVNPSPQAQSSKGNILGKIDPRLTNTSELTRTIPSDRIAAGQPQQPNAEVKGQTAPKEQGATAANLNAPASGTAAITGEFVDIKCMVTPALVKIITDAGGVLISSSKEDNIITAKIPAAAIQKIAASPDVKQISPSPAPNMATAKSESLNGGHVGNGINSSKSIISPSVLKSKGLSQQVVTKTATY